MVRRGGPIHLYFVAQGHRVLFAACGVVLLAPKPGPEPRIFSSLP